MFVRYETKNVTSNNVSQQIPLYDIDHTSGKITYRRPLVSLDKIDPANERKLLVEISWLRFGIVKNLSKIPAGGVGPS